MHTRIHVYLFFTAEEMFPEAIQIALSHAERLNLDLALQNGFSICFEYLESHTIEKQRLCQVKYSNFYPVKAKFRYGHQINPYNFT